MDNNKKKSFWATLPGILTAAAGFVTAIAGLIGVLYQVGVIGDPRVPPPERPRSEQPTPPVPREETPAPPEPQRTFRVVEASLRADPFNYSGPCPITLTFAGRISVVGGNGTVSYRFARSDGASAPIRRISFDQAGSKDVQTSWRLGGPGFTYSGWQALRIFEPQELDSNRASFNVRCEERGAGIPPPKKPEISQVDFDAVQQIYVALRTTVDCREIKHLVDRLTAYYTNTNLVPENARYSVLYPTKKEVPTIADLARDRVIRIQGAKRDCFRD